MPKEKNNQADTICNYSFPEGEMEHCGPYGLNDFDNNLRDFEEYYLFQERKKSRLLRKKQKAEQQKKNRKLFLIIFGVVLVLGILISGIVIMIHNQNESRNRVLVPDKKIQHQENIPESDTESEQSSGETNNNLQDKYDTKSSDNNAYKDIDENPEGDSDVEENPEEGTPDKDDKDSESDTDEKKKDNSDEKQDNKSIINNFEESE